jgi:peptidyl-prolyl cis-trans isomerase A (cyclophilin A)
MSARNITTLVLAAAFAASAPLLAQRGKPAGGASASAAAASKAKLKNPAALKETAPAEYKAEFDTSAGTFVVAVHRAWAPKGADRFYNLVKYGFYDECRFFRVMPNFMVQFGLNGTTSIQAPWSNASITDDPVKQSNRRVTITFANAGPNSRTTQVFINYRNNAGLDPQGFAPFGEVVSGMEAVDKIYGGYCEKSNEQENIKRRGNAYLTKAFPKLDYIKTARIVAAGGGL